MKDDDGGDAVPLPDDNDLVEGVDSPRGCTGVVVEFVVVVVLCFTSDEALLE